MSFLIFITVGLHNDWRKKPTGPTEEMIMRNDYTEFQHQTDRREREDDLLTTEIYILFSALLILVWKKKSL